MRLPNPALGGDGFYSRPEVLEKRESKFRRISSIVTVMTSRYTQDGTVVITAGAP
jgi:hypothetical protein